MLSKNLKEIREKTDISQGKLAKLLVEKGVLKHCSPAYISSLENKQFTNFDLFVSICECLNIQVSVVLYYDERMAVNKVADYVAANLYTDNEHAAITEPA